jgi:hypothetical protein
MWSLMKGRIIERGTHKELLAKGGFYADLYNSQFTGADIEVDEKARAAEKACVEAEAAAHGGAIGNCRCRAKGKRMRHPVRRAAALARSSPGAKLDTQDTAQLAFKQVRTPRRLP